MFTTTVCGTCYLNAYFCNHEMVIYSSVCTVLGIGFHRQSLPKALLGVTEICTLSAQVPHCLSCPKDSRLSVGEITREKNHLVLPG